MKTILAPVDFSGATKAVVAEAAVFARAVKGRVVLLSVILPPVSLAGYTLMESIAEITVAGEKAAAKTLAKLQGDLERDGISTDTLQFVGSPIIHIVEQAVKLKADYIIMGSHGHTALYDLLVGSTTHGVLMRAKCPVVIVPAKEKASRVRETKTKTEPRAALV